MRIRDKVFHFALIAPVFFTVMTVALILVIYFTNRNAIIRQNAVREKSVVKLVGDFGNRTAAYADMIATAKDVQDGAEFDKCHFVHKVIDPLFKSIAVDIITVYEFEGYVIARAHDLDNFGQYNRNSRHVARAFDNLKTSGITRIDGKLALTSTVPVVSTNKETNPIVGAVTVGYAMDNKFAARIRDLVGADVIMANSGKPFASSFRKDAAKDLKSAKLDMEEGRLSLSGRSYDFKRVALPGGGNYSLFLAVDNTDAERTLWILIIACSAIIGATFMFVIQFSRKFSSNLAKPIIETAKHAERVASGDLDVKPLDIKRQDEIGKLVTSFNIMVSNLKDLISRDKSRREYLEHEVDKLQTVMAAAAGGDLSVHFDTSGDDEIARIGTSLNKMIHDVREMVEADKGRREYLEGQVAELLKVMDAAAGGDFEARFEVARDDEIGRIGQSLNTMIEDLHCMIHRDKERRRELERKVKNLLDGIDTAAHGDLSVSFPDNMKDEFGRIGGALNRMLSDLKKKIQQIEELKLQDQKQKEDLEDQVAAILRTVSRAAEGDLTVRLQTGTGAGAIGALKTNLNVMLENLMGMIARVEEGSRLVESTCRMISDTAITIEKGAAEQMRSMEETTSAVDAMAAAIATMARHADDVMSLSANATAEARAGSDTSEQAVHGMTLVEETMADLHEVMKELDTGAEEIEDVVKVIDEISDQTNLLALNASIEAARAGEHGKGFAVVAKEVGSLAQKSVNSTREITIIIRRIQDRVRKAAETAETGRDRVRQGSELVNQAVDALSRIVHSVDEVTRLNRETASALDSQKNDSAQIFEAIKGVAVISQQSTSVIEEAVTSLNTLFNLSKDLEKLVKQFKIS